MTTDGDTLRTLDDGALLAWYADERSQSAFAVLVERHAPMVHGACRRSLGRQSHLAEDAAQAVFLLLAEQAAKLREQTDVGPWLFRVAGYVTANLRRAEQRRQAREAEVAAETPTISKPSDGEWAQAVPHLNDAILTLRPKQQQVVVLHYLEGRPATEVARILGCSDGAVRERLAYALEKLRATLRRRGVAVSTTALAAGLASQSASAVEATVVGVCAAAGGSSSALGKPVLALAEGVRRVWFWSQVKAVAAGLTLLVALGGAGVGAVAVAGESGPAPVVLGDFPVMIELDKPATVTAVIEDAQGKRVRHLISETRLPAGKNRLSWDGFDDGVRDREGNLVRTRVAPGSYKVRGLTHDGITTTYEFPLYSGGNPPWRTADHRGAWLADHSSPYGAVAIQSGSPFGGGKAQLMFSAIVAETGDGLIWTDSDGKKLHGSHMFGWDGAVWLAHDDGKAVADVMVYCLIGWQGKRLVLRGISREGKPLEIATITTRTEMPREPGMIGLTVAVRDGLAAVSLPLDGAIAFIDCAKRQVLGTVPLADPKGVTFDRTGRLYAVSGTNVRRFTVKRPADGGMPTLDAGTVVVASGLEAPYGVAFDGAGDLYVGDWGRSHQVKSFTADGKAKGTIGKPGGLQIGLYDELRMHHPCGMAFDERGRLWVAEADWIPKRISCWDPATGKLIDAKYGPPHYGGGGTIDPQDPTRAFYAEYGGIMEFKLDWKAGTSRLHAIVTRQQVQKFGRMPGENWFPERPVRVGGRTYLINGWQGALRGNTNTAIFLLDEKTRIARPVAYVGSDRYWPEVLARADIAALAPGGKHQNFMVWTDLNADGQWTPEEFAYRVFTETFTDAQGRTATTFGYRDFAAQDDLGMQGVWGISVPPPTIRADGTPLYDLSKARFQLPPNKDVHGNEDGEFGWRSTHGSVLFRFTEAWRGSELVWRYPSRHQNGPPQFPGEMVDPTRALGPPVKASVGEAGEWYGLNGERGNIFLMTTDGLFIQTIGGDMRTSPLLRPDEAKRGMRVDGMSFEDEHFHPTITQTTAGDIRLVAGKEHSSIFTLGGFASIKRRDFPSVTVGASEIAKMSATWTIPARKQGRGLLAVDVRSDGPAIDGKLDDWVTSQWATIGTQAKGAVMVSGDRMFAAFRTGDAKALTNDAANPTFLFKGGGAVDLMIGTDPSAPRNRTAPVAGDLRLLIAKPRGKLTVMLYRAVVPGTAEAKRTWFESPIGKVAFDQVGDVTTQVQVAEQNGDIEVSLPLTLIGLTPRMDMELHADLGVLRGNGTQTIQRSYWNNLDTAIVSDIPSEARLQPANWGVWKFRRGAAAVARAADTPKDVVPGLSVAVYEGSWANLPDVAKLTSVKKEVVKEVSLAPATRQERYVLVFTGWIQVPRDGVYTFGITSDDGSRLSLGGQVLADNDGTHGMQEATGAVNLRAGLHPIRIEYLQATHGAGLEVRWETPGGSREMIPASAWRTTP